ncbi:hypothetical protein AB5J62_34870 [Amycolatopsis sp. cg5]|uniref:hypothetical protein n=1 Tax=Amycolatopsis sp. cg5 TaxID=3238802 RepID=UPI003523D9D1
MLDFAKALKASAAVAAATIAMTVAGAGSAQALTPPPNTVGDYRIDVKIGNGSYVGRLLWKSDQVSWSQSSGRNAHLVVEINGTQYPANNRVVKTRATSVRAKVCDDNSNCSPWE